MTEEEAAQLRATHGTSDFDVAFDAVLFRWHVADDPIFPAIRARRLARRRHGGGDP